MREGICKSAPVHLGFKPVLLEQSLVRGVTLKPHSYPSDLCELDGEVNRTE